MKFRLFLGIAFLAFQAPAHAADGACGEVDLRPALGPVLDQGITGHCFAHSSADLIAAATGRRVSPLDLATSYILSNPEPILNSRSPAILDYLRERPKFLADWRKDRNDEPENFTTAKILSDEGIYWTGGEEMQTIFLANIFGLCDQDKLPAGDPAYTEYLASINAYHQGRLARREYSERERTDPIGEVAEPEARIAAHSFQNWVNLRCGRHWLPAKPVLPDTLRFAKTLKEFEQLNSLNAFSTVDVHGQLFEKIDQQLDRGQVVSIGYSTNDIMKYDKNYPTGDHASVIAARKTQEGKCYYFVRNSFGDSSENYLARFRRTYESGGVWVRAKDLKSIYSVVWIR